MKAPKPTRLRCTIQLISHQDMASELQQPRQCTGCLDRVQALRDDLAWHTFAKAHKEAASPEGVSPFPIRTRAYRSRSRDPETGKWSEPPEAFIVWRCQVHRPQW